MASLSPGAKSAPELKCFTNCQLCISGELIPQDLYFSPETGLITPNYYYRTEGVERIDLNGAIVSPGFLDLQTNGMLGVHFTSLGDDDKSDRDSLSMIAEKELSCGVTGFWATVPTVAAEKWQEVLPSLAPRTFAPGATLLGAHCEGPYLQSDKKGAHNASHFQAPTAVPPSTIYGSSNLSNNIKLITLAPELPGTTAMIGSILEDNPHIVISLGHSSATYEDGIAALDAGATALTHTFNAMAPLHHRNPGLAGVTTTGRCYFSVIPDGIHLHPAVLALVFRADPTKCVLITDSIELAGLPDGIHPGHGQIPQNQLKVGNHVTIAGTDTLIGSCCALDECVRNMVEFTHCTLAEAVRCVTENVAAMMGENKRGSLEFGRRADFAVLNGKGLVKETWIGGVRMFEAGKE